MYEPKDPRQGRLSRTLTSPLLGLVPIAIVALVMAHHFFPGLI